MPAPKDPRRYKEWKKNLRIAWKNAERKKLMGEALKGRNFSKETIRKMSEFAKTRVGKKNPFFGKHHTEEAKRKIGLANKGKNSANYGKTPWNKGKIYDEKMKRKMSKIAKKVHAEHPEIRKRISISRKGKNFTKEHAFNISKSIKKFYKKNLIFNRREKNPMWQGGISYKPYNLLFNNSLKKIISGRDSNKCVNCGNNNKCILHHINYLKAHSSLMNCIWVCMNCNSKFNVNRDYWFAYWCNFLGIGPEENMKEAEIITKMNKKELILFMKNGWRLK